MAYVKQFYRKLRITERDRLWRRLEYLEQYDMPGDFDEIDVLREILMPRAMGCGGIPAPTSRAEAKPTPPKPLCECGGELHLVDAWQGECYCCECGELRLDTSLHR